MLPGAFAEAGLQAERIGRSDLADLEEMHQDPSVMAHIGGVRDPATTAAFLETNMAHWDRHGFGIYALRTPDGRFVGRAGLRWVEPVGRPEVEVAYALRSEFWGRGFALAVTNRLCDLAAAAGLCREVVAFTVTSNRQSWRVMQKAGFAFERHFDLDGSPHVLYRRAVPPLTPPVRPEAAGGPSPR